MELIMPYFVVEGLGRKEPVKSMPGIFRFSVDNLIKDIKEARALGIKSVLIFGIPRRKDESASEGYSDTGVVQDAVRQIKNSVKGIAVITDACLCAYTTHGHCRIMAKPHPRGGVLVWDEKKTREALAKIAVSHAKAGADFVAPSAMMPGQVKAIRAALDKNGFKKTRILAYSAKFASSFYGPFRDALNSSPKFGDRTSYQLDFTDDKEALRRIAQDIKEGADIVMIKPALAYLDIIRQAKDRFNVPIAAYNVSGEYAMVKFLKGSGTFRKNIVLEILAAIKRAGADLIISYHAKEAAKWKVHVGV